MKIYYATQVDINDLGAARSVDIPMVKNLTDLGHYLIWLGINVNNEGNIANEVISLKQSKSIKLIIRIKNRLLRLLRLETIEHQKLKALKRYDKWQASVLEQRKDEIDHNVLFIGRGVGSELSFKTIKKYGGYCVLHSQWMHPDTQKNILDGALSKLLINYTQVLPERANVQKREIESCDKVWCISNLVYDSYLKSVVHGNKLFLCPLGVDSEVFKPISYDTSTTKERFVIIFVGNVNIEKGVHILLNALVLGRLSNCQVILNGGIAEYFKETMMGFLEKLKDLDVEVIFAVGFPLENLQKADLFILPSLHESFGLTVLEAMACSLQVIVTDQVGSSDHVIYGVNGFVVDANSSEALSNKIKYFYENPEAKILFGKESRKIAENLNYRFIAKKFISSLGIKNKI